MHLIPGLVLMAAAVAMHLVGGLAVILYLGPRVKATTTRPLLNALRLVVLLFAALLLLHLMQVALWALLYWWQIDWDPNTALYFSAVTYATIGYGDVVPPPRVAIGRRDGGAHRGPHARLVECHGVRRRHAVARRAERAQRCH